MRALKSAAEFSAAARHSGYLCPAEPSRGALFHQTCRRQRFFPSPTYSLVGEQFFGKKLCLFRFCEKNRCRCRFFFQTSLCFVNFLEQKVCHCRLFSQKISVQTFFGKMSGQVFPALFTCSHRSCSSFFNNRTDENIFFPPFVFFFGYFPGAALCQVDLLAPDYVESVNVGKV